MMRREGEKQLRQEEERSSEVRTVQSSFAGDGAKFQSRETGISGAPFSAGL